MPKRNINHIEIPSKNTDESGKFYGALFGWKITPIPEANYTVWESGEGSRGGFTPLDEGVLIYVDSDDIAADLKKAQSLGAKILQEKTEIPGRGWYGLFQDPSGNRIGLFTRRVSS